MNSNLIKIIVSCMVAFCIVLPVFFLATISPTPSVNAHISSEKKVLMERNTFESYPLGTPPLGNNWTFNGVAYAITTPSIQGNKCLNITATTDYGLFAHKFGTPLDESIHKNVTVSLWFRGFNAEEDQEIQFIISESLLAGRHNRVVFVSSFDGFAGEWIISDGGRIKILDYSPNKWNGLLIALNYSTKKWFAGIAVEEMPTNFTKSGKFYHYELDDPTEFFRFYAKNNINYQIDDFKMEIVYYAPIIISRAPQTIIGTNRLYSYTAISTPSDRGNIYWTLSGNATWLSVVGNPNGTTTCTIAGISPPTPGYFNVALTVNDSESSHSLNYILYVKEFELINYPSQTAFVGKAYNFKIKTTLGVTSATLKTNAGWLYLDKNTMTLAGTPVSADKTYWVNLKLQNTVGTDTKTLYFNYTIRTAYQHLLSAYGRGYCSYALEWKNMTVTGFCSDNEANPYIQIYNGTWGKPARVGINPIPGNFYGAPVIAINNSGYAHIFWGAYNSIQYYSVSNTPIIEGSNIAPTSFTQTTLYEGASGQYYPKPVILSNGTILLFQMNESDDALYTLAYSFSKDNGKTWSPKFVILQSYLVPYIEAYRLINVNGHLRMYACMNWFVPGSDYHCEDVLFFYFNCTNWHFYNITDYDLGTTLTESELDTTCKAFDLSASGFSNEYCPTFDMRNDNTPIITLSVNISTIPLPLGGFIAIYYKNSSWHYKLFDTNYHIARYAMPLVYDGNNAYLFVFKNDTHIENIEEEGYGIYGGDVARYHFDFDSESFVRMANLLNANQSANWNPGASYRGSYFYMPVAVQYSKAHNFYFGETYPAGLSYNITSISLRYFYGLNGFLTNASPPLPPLPPAPPPEILLIADFSYVIEYNRVIFTDLSVGTITKWMWSFGDGNGSSEQNPVHFYGAVGNYTVMLMVTGADGSQTIAVKTVCITEIQAWFINENGKFIVNLFGTNVVLTAETLFAVGGLFLFLSLPPFKAVPVIRLISPKTRATIAVILMIAGIYLLSQTGGL